MIGGTLKDMERGVKKKRKERVTGWEGGKRKKRRNVVKWKKGRGERRGTVSDRWKGMKRMC